MYRNKGTMQLTFDPKTNFVEREIFHAGSSLKYGRYKSSPTALIGEECKNPPESTGRPQHFHKPQPEEIFVMVIMPIGQPELSLFAVVPHGMFIPAQHEQFGDATKIRWGDITMDNQCISIKGMPQRRLRSPKRKAKRRPKTRTKPKRSSSAPGRTKRQGPRKTIQRKKKKK